MRGVRALVTGDENDPAASSSASAVAALEVPPTSSSLAQIQSSVDIAMQSLRSHTSVALLLLLLLLLLMCKARC